MRNAPVIKTRDESRATFKPHELRRFFVITSQLADLAEDVLERRGEYSDEFLSGLNKSLKEAREGKLQEVRSLSELR